MKLSFTQVETERRREQLSAAARIQLLESKLLASNEHVEALADHLRLTCASSSASHPPCTPCPLLDSRSRALSTSPPLSWRLDMKFASEEKTKILEGNGGEVGGERGGGRDEEEDDVTSSRGWSLDKMRGEESGEAQKVDVVSDVSQDDAQQLDAATLETPREQLHYASIAAASEEGHWRKAFDPESGPIHTHTRTRTHMHTPTLTHPRAHIHTYTHTSIHTELN